MQRFPRFRTAYIDTTWREQLARAAGESSLPSQIVSLFPDSRNRKQEAAETPYKVDPVFSEEPGEVRVRDGRRFIGQRQETEDGRHGSGGNMFRVRIDEEEPAASPIQSGGFTPERTGEKTVSG